MFYKKKKSQPSPVNKQHEKKGQVSKVEAPRAGLNKDKKDKENLQTPSKDDSKNKTNFATKVDKKSSPTLSPSRNSQLKNGELGGIKVQLREKFSDD